MLCSARGCVYGSWGNPLRLGVRGEGDIIGRPELGPTTLATPVFKDNLGIIASLVKLNENVGAWVFSTGPALKGGVAVMVLGKTKSGWLMGDIGFADRGVSGIVKPGIEKGVDCLLTSAAVAAWDCVCWSCVLMAVMGSHADGNIGVLCERSTTVAYTLDSVLNAVGSLGSRITSFREEAILELGTWVVLIWRAGLRDFEWGLDIMNWCFVL